MNCLCKNQDRIVLDKYVIHFFCMSRVLSESLSKHDFKHNVMIQFVLFFCFFFILYTGTYNLALGQFSLPTSSIVSR